MPHPDEPPKPGLPVPFDPGRGEGATGRSCPRHGLNRAGRCSPVADEGERGGAERPSPERLERPHPTAPSEQSSQGSVSFSPPGRSENPPAPYRRRHDGWRAARKGKFFRALAETGCVRDACRIADISSTSAYRMRTRDKGFAGEWFAALESAQPGLEAAAYRRAVEGVEEPIVSGGKVIGTKRKYSDALLRMLIERGDMKDRLRGHPDFITAEEYRAGWGFDQEGNKIKQSVEDAFEEIKRRLALIKKRETRRVPGIEGDKPDADGGGPGPAGGAEG